MAARDAAKHYNTISDADYWINGPLGWFIRVRGLIVTIVGKAIAAGFTFWATHWYWGVIVLAVSLATTFVLFKIRNDWRRFATSSESLHNFSHQTRDDVQELLKTPDQTTRNLRIQQFNKSTVQRVAEFFRALIGNSDINCAIRLAEVVDGRMVYSTVARSEGMNTQRTDLSEPIPADKGLAHALRSKEGFGAFVIRDISEATEVGIWHPAPTDRLDDVRTLMVTPINSTHTGNRTTLGMLYVTSGSNPFRPMHTIPLKAFADILGLVYPLIIEKADK